MHRNYRSVDLGLDDTCKELGVSNSYFSSLFKKETGSSFVEYLTDYRMDKAARMLVETDDKSYVIAQNVGYADPNYFSYVFKRSMGFPHPGTGQSMRRIRYKSGNIQSIIMLSFSLLSFAIMLVTVVVMYIKFADASQDSIIESNHKVMDQTIDSVESYLVNMRQVSDAAYYDVIKGK